MPNRKGKHLIATKDSTKPFGLRKKRKGKTQITEEGVGGETDIFQVNVPQVFRFNVT